MQVLVCKNNLLGFQRLLLHHCIQDLISRQNPPETSLSDIQEGCIHTGQDLCKQQLLEMLLFDIQKKNLSLVTRERKLIFGNIENIVRHSKF